MIYQTQKEKIKRKYTRKMFFLKPYAYDEWLKKVKLIDNNESTDKK